MAEQPQTGSNQGKNAVVLLSSDVTVRNNQVFMPNTIELAQIKKPAKGQFVNHVLFTREMTEEQVKSLLCSRLPVLQNQRFCCASAVENRTKLEFHGEPRVWDGDSIRRTIRGNSALYIYILPEEAPNLSRVSHRPTVEHSYHSAGTVSIADTRQFASLHSQQKRTGGKRKNDRSQGVPLSAKQKKGNNDSHFLQTFKWGSSDLVQPMLQLAQQRHPSTTTTSTANPNNSTCSIQNVTSKLTSLNQLSRTLTTTVQHQDFPTTHTVTQSTVGPGQQTYSTHGNLPTVFSKVSQQISASSAAQQGDSNMQSSAQRGSAQFFVPAVALQQNGKFNLNLDAVEDPNKLLQQQQLAMQQGVSLPVTIPEITLQHNQPPAKQIIFISKPGVGPDQFPVTMQGPQQVWVQRSRGDHSKVPQVGSSVQILQGSPEPEIVSERLVNPTAGCFATDPSHQKREASLKENNSSTQNVAIKQGSVTQLSRRTAVQRRYFPITHTVTQSTVGPSQQTHATHFNLPTVFSPGFQKSASSTAVQQGDFKRSAQGSSFQNNSSIQHVVSEQSSGNPISLTTPFQHQDLQAAPAVAQETAQFEPFQQTATSDKQAIPHESDSGWDSNKDDAVNVAHDTAGAGQVGLLSTPLVHNPGGQPILEVEQRVVDTGISGGQMSPNWGYTKEETKILISFTDPLPDDVLSFVADFEGLETAELKLLNPYTLIGHSPICHQSCKVKVRLTIFSGNGCYSYGEDLYFEYKDQILQVLEKVNTNETAKDAAWKGFFEGLTRHISSGSDESNPFCLPAAGSSTINDSSNSHSVELLTLLVYRAAQINSHEYLEVIFSTSAGTIVFNHYKYNTTLPEDVARASGHVILGDYLEKVNKRLSKEVGSEDNNETINWLELKHAVEKKQNLPFTPGTDDAQPASCSDSNDDQSDYDADDETSPFSSPSSIEVTDSKMHDSEYEDDNDAHESIPTKAEKQQDRTENTNEDDPGKKIGSLPRGVDNMKTNGITTVSWIAEVDHEATHDSEKSNLNWAQECEFQPNPEVTASAPEEITKVALHLNQEGADPVANSNVASAVVTVARETPNSTVLASEVVRNSLTSHHNQGPIAGMVTVPLCGDRNNVQRLAGPFIQTTTENTHYESSTYNETAQEEAVDCHDHPLRVTTDHSKQDVKEDSDNPPRLSFDLPKLSDIPKGHSYWNDVQLPVDILLLTVEDCEFLACFHYLDEPFKSYNRDVGGYVYFGSVGNDDEKKFKIALMKCSKGSAVPGWSLTVTKNAVKVLRPKAVLSVGTCSGLYCEKTKLGDVVVSSKLTALGHKTATSKNVSYLVRDAAVGWNPPLKDPDVQEVKVHCGGEVLYGPEAVSEDIIQQHPEAVAVVLEGEGFVAAAHDLKMEWILIKGIKDYVNGDQPSSDEWGVFASVMAASVVANILRDPIIIQDWCHSGEGTNDTPILKTLRPITCPENDDKQSDYSEDDKTSSHNEFCGTKNEGHGHNTKGYFEKANECYQRALDVNLENLGPEHRVVATSCPLKKTGPEHVYVATTCSNLGSVHQALGDVEKAKEYHTRAPDIRLKKPGPGHVDVATYYSNLGSLHQASGNIEMANDYYTCALDIRLKKLGPEHVDVATTYSNLGSVRQALGDLEKAKEYHARALDIQLTKLGPEHVEVQSTFINLGSVHVALGDIEEAKYYYERALGIPLKKLAPEPVDAATTYSKLGSLHQALGDIKEAKDYACALEIRLKKLGPAHVDVATTYSNLGSVHHALGDLEKAKECYQRALDVNLENLGPEHRVVATSCPLKKTRPEHVYVATTCSNLGFFDQGLGDFHRGKDYQRLKNLRPEHVAVVTSYNNLGSVHQALGDFERAKNCHDRALAIQLKNLGPEHVEVAMSSNNFGSVRQALGDFERAKDYHYRAEAIRLKKLRPEHVKVATSYCNLGSVHQALGDIEKAKEKYDRALDIRLKKPRPEDVEVATSYSNLGSVHQALGDIEKAKEKYDRALDIRLKKLGPEHVDV